MCLFIPLHKQPGCIQVLTGIEALEDVLYPGLSFSWSWRSNLRLSPLCLVCLHQGFQTSSPNDCDLCH